MKYSKDVSFKGRRRKMPEDYPEFPPEPPEFAAKIEEWMPKARFEDIRVWHWVTDPKFSVGPRVLPASFLIWFRQIDGDARVLKNRFRIGSGDLLIIPQATEHEFSQSGRAPAEFIAAPLDARIFGNVSFFDLLGFPIRVRDNVGNVFEHAFNVMAWEYARKPVAWRMSLATQVSRVLLHVIRQHAFEFRINRTGGSISLLTRMLPAFEIIEKRFRTSHLKVEELADAAHFGQTRFRQLFSKVTGLSPINYLQRRRVEEACSLLGDGSYGMAQVAEMSGFSDLAFFTRVFRKWTGTTPGRYAAGERRENFPPPR